MTDDDWKGSRGSNSKPNLLFDSFGHIVRARSLETGVAEKQEVTLTPE